MRSKALLSLGFSKSYFAQSLHEARSDLFLQMYSGGLGSYFVKPLPSMRTTIQVFGRR